MASRWQLTFAATTGAETEGLGTTEVVLIVVAGLVLVALVLSIVTWRYWRATRPVPAERRGLLDRRDRRTRRTAPAQHKSDGTA